MPAQRAWLGPCLVQERLGSFDMSALGAPERGGMARPPSPPGPGPRYARDDGRGALSRRASHQRALRERRIAHVARCTFGRHARAPVPRVPWGRSEDRDDGGQHPRDIARTVCRPRDPACSSSMTGVTRAGSGFGIRAASSGEWPLFGPPESCRGVRLEGTRSTRELVALGQLLDGAAIERLTRIPASASRPCSRRRSPVRAPRWAAGSFPVTARAPASGRALGPGSARRRRRRTGHG